jgi:hypothetical protein
MIASITLIMQNGVEGVAGDFQGQDVASDSNDDEYESENDEKVEHEEAGEEEDESDENNILRGGA